MGDIIELLRPVLGELMSVLVTLIIAWMKKRFDKKQIKSRITTLLINKSVPSDIIEEVMARVDTKQGKNGSEG